MDQGTPDQRQIARTGLAVAVVFGLLHLANTGDLLSDFTRPVIVGFLRLLGVAARNEGGSLVLGRLNVPWTRDCAGLNVLMVLWAVTLWANRAQPAGPTYWLRLAGAVPAAFAANLGRIFTLIAYRGALYPAVESPQLHYFIGFAWLIPLLGLFVPRGGRVFSVYFLETLYFAGALSLLAPFVPSPGGSVVALATLLVLLQSRWQPAWTMRHGLLGGAWLLAGTFIGASGMESLWVPWLLVCPWFAHPAVVLHPAGLLLVAGTIPLVAMQPVASAGVLLAAGWEAWRLYRTPPAPSTVPSTAAVPSALPVAVGVALLLPFIASSLGALGHRRLLPPAGCMAREFDVNSFRVRTLGQPPDLELTWYGPYGEGRHHTLSVCMRYRGIHLKPVAGHPDVLTDGERWMREFFLLNGEVIPTYRAYLRRTFSPLASPGVHLLASMPVSAAQPESFDRVAQDTARRLVLLGSAGKPRE